MGYFSPAGTGNAVFVFTGIPKLGVPRIIQPVKAKQFINCFAGNMD